MKTLISIKSPELKEMFFPEHVIGKLEAFSEVEWFESTGESFDSEGLTRIIGDYDACLTSWGSPFFTKKVLENAPKLKFIGHVAGSATAVVDEDVYGKDIAVTTANIVLAKSTAEAAVALILAGAWDLLGYSSRLKAGQWCNNSKDTVMGLSNQVIGLIGLGEISRNVIAYLRGFPVKIKLASRYCTDTQAAELGVDLCSLEELLQTSQIISLHTALTPSSVGMLGERELSLIQDGALFVNTARAKIVDEAALTAQLQSKRFFAALDVYHAEPLPMNHPFQQLDNVICVPHIGGFARTYKRFMGEFIIDNLKDFSESKRPQGQVSREEYNRMTSSIL
ncbi:hydroxyacid dehydrogenase [Paenibacillus psychroresistens]|uniref:Hydroxyacid dehydrogenase n=1 Tax=Paenibacillus psychroresistens TaxID=1778678 RepID=A0A6B8RPW0_9BACL|nr:hydroxyacid dehydrogenase [Paenibacillus psychroresistens]QGQ98411.1 hydroxyacid dehydrogenase [Paenibacillus psychroresistens]